MTFANQPHAHRSHSAGGEQYLESAVQTASPARLRLMLIERAVEVAGTLAKTWRSRQHLGTNEYSIKLLELLNELLSGVVGGGNQNEKEVCHKVADLYVFLIQHLVAAECKSDAESIDEIQIVLGVEAETWRAACAQSMPVQQSVAPDQAGLNLQA